MKVLLATLILRTDESEGVVTVRLRRRIGEMWPASEIVSLNVQELPTNES